MRVVDETGKQLGVLQTTEALQLAKSRGFDLVEVSPLAEPPVCKIIDYGQLQYEQNKKERKQKSKQRKSEIKGIRLSTTIGSHDMDVRVEQAKKFLSKGHKVQVELMLRGRQKAHPEIGKEVLERFIVNLEEIAKVEGKIEMKGGKFSVNLMTKK